MIMRKEYSLEENQDTVGKEIPNIGCYIDFLIETWDGGADSKTNNKSS